MIFFELFFVYRRFDYLFLLIPIQNDYILYLSNWRTLFQITNWSKIKITAFLGGILLFIFTEINEQSLYSVLNDILKAEIPIL